MVLEIAIRMIIGGVNYSFSAIKEKRCGDVTLWMKMMGKVRTVLLAKCGCVRCVVLASDSEVVHCFPL